MQYKYDSLFEVDEFDSLQRFGNVRVEGTNFGISESIEAIKISTYLYELATNEEKDILAKTYDVIQSYDDMLKMAAYGKASVGLMILLFGPSFNIIFSVLSKLFPFFETRSYKVTTYYIDGSSETRETVETNVIAILVLGAIIYVYYVGWFWVPTARNIVRLIETKRFGDCCDEYSNVDIMDYYE